MTRAAFLAGALVLVMAGPLLAQEARGNRAYRRDDVEAALDHYRRALDRKESPRVRYNLGSALARLGRRDEARQEFNRALAGQDAELRVRSFYNLGNSLVAGEDVQPTAEDLRAAARAYQRSLLLDPDRTDSKWNLELTLKRLEQAALSESSGDPRTRPSSQSPQPDDASPEGEQPAQGAAQPAPERQRPARPAGDTETPLPLELAEQILNAVEERERDLQRRKLGQRRTRRAGPDW